MVVLWFILIMDAKNVREVEGQNLQVAHLLPWFQSFHLYLIFLHSLLFCPKDGSRWFLQDVSNYLPNYIVSHSRRP
jgi:uncharacterized membrane protein YadS